MQGSAGVWLLCLLAFVRGGPYTKKQREVAESPLVSAAQWFLQERLLGVEMQVLNGSVDVGRLAEWTTRDAYMISEEARVRVEDIAQRLRREYKKYLPLGPQCTNKANYREVVDKIRSLAEEVYLCTHKVADEGTGFEVAFTVQLSEARNYIWSIQEAMYFCEKFQPEVDISCLKRLTVEGLQMLRRVPDRAAQVLDSAQASRADARSRLETCHSHSTTRAEELYLAESQRMRECLQAMREGKEKQPTPEVLGKMGKRTLNIAPVE